MTDAKDDKVMRSFDTGATRDTAEGKIDMEGFEHPMVKKQFAKYMNMNRLQSDGQIRDSDNWQKGIPMDAYIKSLRRHHDDMWQMHRGFPTEAGMIAALCGILFNAHGYLLEYLKEREFCLQDFDGDQPTPEMRGRQDALRRGGKMNAEGQLLLPDCTTDKCYECGNEQACNAVEPAPECDYSISWSHVDVPVDMYHNGTKIAETVEGVVETKPKPNTWIGFCLSEYDPQVCGSICGFQRECILRAWNDLVKRADDRVVRPMALGLEDWIEDLIDVPEVPPCFGYRYCNEMADCIRCLEDEDTCEEHWCVECDFEKECRYDMRNPAIDIPTPCTCGVCLAGEAEVEEVPTKPLILTFTPPLPGVEKKGCSGCLSHNTVMFWTDEPCNSCSRNKWNRELDLELQDRYMASA